MTDEQIIKALECCATDDGDDCFKCPYDNMVYNPGNGGCANRCREDALDLISRQKAEIERLQKAGNEAVSCFTRMESLYKIKCKELEVAKSETIKEFAERLKCGVPQETGVIRCADVDNLVKEMTGEKE